MDATRRHPTKRKQWVREVFYGRLEQVLVSNLPETPFWGTLGGIHLLAVITPCKTEGLDAIKTVTKYHSTTTVIVTDIQTVVSVVGRAFTRGRWGMIDRGTGLAKPVFASDALPADTDDDSDVDSQS